MTPDDAPPWDEGPPRRAPTRADRDLLRNASAAQRAAARRLAERWPDVEAAAMEAVAELRHAQRYRGQDERDRLERVAAALYEALDVAKGLPRWPACPACGERVRAVRPHEPFCRGRLPG